ncbi:MAG: ATP-binding protein, partial [bacterium]
IPVRSEQTGRILGYLYFGETTFVTMLRYIPIGEFLLLLLFFYLLLLESERKKGQEIQNIWLGMARETAHQLGTPISAIFGWLQLLRDKCTSNATDDKGFNIFAILDEMENDVRNLDDIVKRFGKIGSQPELELINVNQVVKDAVEYFRKRTPTLHRKIEFEERYYDGIITIYANRLLLGWAIENILKNSIEALDKGKGNIIIVTRLNPVNNTVNIVITDNGRGIPGNIQKKIFTPGFTTKKRGWGLGLSLAKRIIEEYHYGKLELVESKPYEKTTFSISLPITTRAQSR